MNIKFRAYIVSVLLLIGGVIPSVTVAQVVINNVGSSVLEELIISLQHISHAHSQLLNQLQQQLSDNQHDLDILRGQIQENKYQLNMVAEQQKKIYQYISDLSNSTKQLEAEVVKGNAHLNKSLDIISPLK
ncbi:periplasmic protein [Serratia symbiotica str. 'Cinara cedri']|nr:periplasmic protein [Serratia symbiotica str. 'Cinara cedri']